MEKTAKKGPLGLDYGLLSRCRSELMGLALVWVLAFHAYLWTPALPFPAWLKAKGFTGVDVFIFLSAMGLALSLSRRKQPPAAFYARRFARVLPAYWLVTGGYGLALRLAGRTSLKVMAWTMSTLFYWFRAPNYFNWYIPALLAFYLLTPACFALVERCPFREVLVGAVFCCALPFTTFLDFRGWGHADDFFFRMPVFFLGLLVGLYLARGRELTPRALAVWLCLIPLGPALSTLFPSRGIYFPFPYAFAPVCVPLCLGLSRLLELLRAQGLLRRCLRSLGEASLEIYLLNVVFVLEYPLLGPWLDRDPGHAGYYLITVSLNLLLGLGLHRALKPVQSWLSDQIAKKA